MDARLILAGQTPDIIGTLDRSAQAAGNQIALNQQNALAKLYREQGAGIAAGDQNAINMLAQFDPLTALDAQNSVLSGQQTRQSMAISAEEMQMKREEGKRRTAEALATQAATITAEQLAAEKEAITKGLSGAAFFYQKKDRAGYESFLSENGIDPAEFPFEQFPAHAAMFEGALEAMETFAPPTINPNDRFKVVGSTLMDLGAEGGPAPVAQGAMQETTIFGPDGKPVMVQGGPGTAAKFTEGQSKDNVYATRADGALGRLEPVADALTSIGDRALGLDPTGIVRGSFQSNEYQLAKQAGEEYLQAILRKDTGAAITADEQALYGTTYLPQPGDNAAVLEQKRVARAGALEAIRAGMNPQQLEAVARADAATIARLAAQGGGAPGAPAAAGGPATGGTRLRYNPETGALE